MRYIETGDVLVFFFLFCLLFVPNSRTQETAAAGEIELCRRFQSIISERNRTVNRRTLSPSLSIAVARIKTLKRGRG